MVRVSLSLMFGNLDLGRLARSQKGCWELLGTPISLSLESLGNDQIYLGSI